MGFGTNILIIGGAITVFNKLAFNFLFSKRITVPKVKPFGDGKSIMLTYQFFGRKNWICPLMTNELAINDLIVHDYIDFRLFKTRNKLTCFRPYAHIEKFNNILVKNGLNVKCI